MTAVAVEGTVRPDLTLLVDPATIWPEPAACPDWPYRDGGFTLGPTRGTREAAEARLAELRSWLANGFEVREPKKGEISDLMEASFDRTPEGVSGGPEKRFAALGFAGWSPKPGAKTSYWIVEATHVRGYLRKLDAEAEAEKAAAEEQERAKHRRVLDSYRATRATAERGKETLGEGYARYAQWLADRAAYFRACDIRNELERKREQAEGAAEALGEDLPEPLDLGEFGINLDR